MKQTADEKIAILYRQIQFLDTRLRAYEAVLHTPMDIISAIFFRKSFQERVNILQKALLAEHDQKIREVAQKQREEALKPKINIVGPLTTLALLFFLSGCYTPSQYKQHEKESYDRGYAAANTECLALQAKIGFYVASMLERLKLFNQIDERGELRKLKMNDEDISSWEEGGQ